MRKLSVRLLALVALIAVLGPPAAASAHQKRPLVIGHRGAAGYLPDHTLQGYQLAIDLGADYIEPDLVSTKDGVLIARHEPNMIATTDVASHPEFASRGATVSIDGGAPEEGLFASDFTCGRSRRCARSSRSPNARSASTASSRSRRSTRSSTSSRNEASVCTGRSVSIPRPSTRPTTSGSACRSSRSSSTRSSAHGLNHKGAAVFIQSFEQFNLKKLNQMTPLPLVQLVDANDVNPDGSLDYTAPFDRPYDWTVSGDPKLHRAHVRLLRDRCRPRGDLTYADVISPWKRYIVSSVAGRPQRRRQVGDENGDGNVDEADRKALPPTDLIQRAHRHGLKIHTWTFRDEPQRLLSDYGDNPLEEYLKFYELGIDGVFSDFTGTAVAARHLFELSIDGNGPRQMAGPAGAKGGGDLPPIDPLHHTERRPCNAGR